MTVLRWSYPSLVGLLLGLLQTGLYFQLSFTLTSSFRTFLMVTVCWLVGSAGGVVVAKRWKPSRHLFLILALLAYFACIIMLNRAPYDTSLWPVYAVLIMVTGVYPGIFFATMTAHYSARSLFLRENNGFLLGLVLGTLLFILVGRSVLWVFPTMLSGILLIIGEAPFMPNTR